MTQSSKTAVWTSPPRTLELSPNEVHIFRIDLNRAQKEVETLRRLLDAVECERADAFYFDRDRNHFIVARAVLRMILGDYLNSNPAKLDFRYSEHGKPSLASSEHSKMQFNVSHSFGLCLCAFASEREVGIDVERIRDGPASEGIAENYFTPREVAALSALPIHQRNEGFFNCWTRKEAYIKARGQGLSLPLDSFEVSVAPDEPAQLFDGESIAGDEREWSLRAIYPGDGYCAAIVAEGRDWTLRTWWR